MHVKNRNWSCNFTTKHVWWHVNAKQFILWFKRATKRKGLHKRIDHKWKPVDPKDRQGRLPIVVIFKAVPRLRLHKYHEIRLFKIEKWQSIIQRAWGSDKDSAAQFIEDSCCIDEQVCVTKWNKSHCAVDEQRKGKLLLPLCEWEDGVVDQGWVVGGCPGHETVEF